MSWNIDSAHTRALFSVRHMMITTVHGQFRKVDGTVNFDPENPTATSVDVHIDAASIDTQEQQRDAHLRSADFLDAENYPAITFKSTKVEPVDDRQGRLFGDLTIRNISRPVVLEVEYAGMVKNPWGKDVAGFSAKTSINRKDWDLNWNVALETGGVLVGDKINVNIELEIVRAEAPEPVSAG